MKITSLILVIFFLRSAIDYNYEVKVAGSMKNIMMKNDLSAQISLDTLQGYKNIYGLGAAEDLQGELLILDGKAYQCSVEKDLLKTVQGFDTKASLLVYTQVKSWQTTQMPHAIRNYKELESSLEKMSKSSGMDLNKPFPFMLKGKIKSATYHVIAWEKATAHTFENHKQFAKAGKFEDESVEILGFYSTKHHSIFTHHSTNMHLHITDRQRKTVGHLEEISFEKGMTLMLPQ